jgi:hypothetical protein
MQLDRKKSFATIYGHVNAIFEQDGMLFNGSGKQVFEPEAEISDPDTEHDSVESFLKNALNETSLSRKKVAELAEKAGFAWLDVETTAGLLNVQRRKQGVGEVWKINQ